MVMSAAATHSPRNVQFYCIDLGGGGLIYLENLPHVGGVANRSEPDKVNRVVAEMQAVMRQRKPPSRNTEWARSGCTGSCVTIQVNLLRPIHTATSF